MDMSTPTGESLPVLRTADAVVYATGMHTEMGRIAAPTQNGGTGLAFMPVGMLLGGLSLGDTLNFAIGRLVANVPEGLLHTITLALAVGARLLARRGALVERISAVEILGSASVICTDKTGTLTMNRMEVLDFWTVHGEGSPVAGDSGEPTELALLHTAASLGTRAESLGVQRLAQFH